jgi:hypothetical protein
MKRALLSLVLATGFGTVTVAGEIGFVEEFALAKDRAEALKKLIPGTDDYYYYHCLHFLNSEQYDKVEAMTRLWYERHGQSGRLTEIQTRHALLTYDKDPQRSLAYLRQRLGLSFNHQKVVADGPPNLPTSLDQQLIARSALLAGSMSRWNNLSNFEDSALDWLAVENLNWERRRELLQRLTRSDIANLPKLVVEDLRSPHAQPFGAFGIHRQLTQSQLDEVLKLKDDLLNQTAYVHAYITKLRPTDDEDWRRDNARTRVYLDRLMTFARRLDPVHNPLKAHILHHRLVLDRSLGTYDKALFDEYLKLPRQQGYMAKRMLESEQINRYPADLNANFLEVTLLPTVGNDEPLVRSYLKHFFLTAENTKEYEPYINDVYLAHLFAETKIENGLGDPETWASRLPPELYRQLKDRIDIDFAFTNKTAFAADEPVRLDLFVKNVPTMLVKVFEINTSNFYRTQQREVDTDVNLDGLVANVEEVHKYGDAPVRRIAKRFEFPQLTKPGVYVVDFIGGGKSSRALIRKGRLRPLVAASTAGNKISVVNDANQPVKDVTLWLGGQEYKADADGFILVPFSTSPGRRPVVLSRGDFSCLDYLQHQPEQYHLAAGIHIDREALLTQRIATLLIRPGLYLNGLPSSVKLLEEVRLHIVAVDQDGISTSTEVPDFKLFEDRESTHEFRVPARLATLSISLHAKVKSLSLNKPVDLSSSRTFGLNGISKTERIEDLHLAKFGTDYLIELLGRSGEAKPDRPVRLAIKHRDFREAVSVTLKTDSLGRVRLGALADIVSVSATGPEGTSHSWHLPTDRHTYRHLLHVQAGAVATVPYVGAMADAAREELALFEMRGDVVQSDRFDALSIRNGMIEAKGLAAGDYDLWLKRSGERIRIRIVDGGIVAGHVLGKLRHMQALDLSSVQIASIKSDADSIFVQLQDGSKFARVHVFATRYLPTLDAYANLGAVRAAELRGVYPAHAESAYLTGRNIGDEFRYVLDRRLHRKFPGNMLERPALLLNPWVLRSTETGEQLAVGGDHFAPKGEPPATKDAPAEGGGSGSGGRQAADDSTFANLDFLNDASAILLNLTPDKNGVVKFSRKDLGPHAHIHVVAVDPVSTTYRSISLPEQAASFVDLRLRQGLDAKAHFTQQKQVSLLRQGQSFVLADAAGSRFEVYDSLAKVYGLYSTLSKDPKLVEFSFILTWPTLKIEEKRKLYSKYACHELHYFLSKKDPEFFQTAVRPYLVNKKDKTFLDRWLLDENLQEFTQPWQYGRLNTVERVLLAQRLAGETSKTARLFDELLRLQTPNADRLQFLFETAVKGSELAATDATGLTRFKQLEEQKKRLEQIPGEMPAKEPAKPAAPGMPGPTGGSAFRRPDDAPRRDGRGDAKGAKYANDAAGKDANGERYFQDDREKDKAPAQLYRKLDPTLEWAENNYYHLPIGQQTASLVANDPFWLDYVRTDGKAPFLTRHLAAASRNFTEMMFALSVLDLPFTAGKHDTKFDAGRMTFVSAGSAIAFHEEVKPVLDAAGKVQILVSENFYRHGDRYREEGGERFDKFITDEFVIHTVYGGQVVVTNPTPSRQKLAVLVQIPVGAIPVANGQYTKTVMLDLEPYRTQTIDYLFYFPRAGKFAHFPVHVAKAETLVSSAQATTFNVVPKPTKLDTESWDYISQHGTNEAVLAYLNRENVHALNLERIAFRMRDKEFFVSSLQLLRDRHAYHPTLWSYAINHNVVAAGREYLTNVDQIVGECGGPIVSPLLIVDPVSRHQYEHLEYKPLVNARAHSLGRQRQIVNDRFNQQYHSQMKLLTYRKQLTDDDQLAVSYYLLLQDRVEEALAAFALVNPERVATKLQYDLCAAYLDMFTDEPNKARAIAARHLAHPVDRWRNTFAAVANQLDEIAGKGTRVADAEDRSQRQGQLAANEPNVEFTIDNKMLNVAWQNVEAVRINYYLMDVELLFSHNPFVQQSGGQFSTIRPNFIQEVKLPPKQSKLSFRLPEDLVRRNVLVEISAGGKTRSVPYYANAMDVKLTENYGQLRVTDAVTGKALPKVYVKTYVRLANGVVKFYKDGYADLRGRFDYTSVSTPEQSPIARFAVLVLSDEHGALIREAAPPQQ